MQIWYQPGHLNSIDEFDLDLATLVTDEFDPGIETFLLTGLLPDSDYTVLVISEDSQGYTSDPCLLIGNTLNNTCSVPIDPSWIYDANTPDNPPIELFDEQANFDPFCGTPGSALTEWGLDFFNGPEMVSVDLQDYYYLNALAIFDMAAVGVIDIDYATSPNGPWLDLVDYTTTAFDEWITLDNLLPPNEPLRYLRITADPNNNARIGEFYFCGALAPFDDSAIPPGPVLNLSASNSTCNSIDLSWTASFDTDINTL